jgi:hypothetical protein
MSVKPPWRLNVEGSGLLGYVWRRLLSQKEPIMPSAPIPRSAREDGSGTDAMETAEL